MSAMTDAERKAAQRARDKKNGMFELRVKIHKSWKQHVRDYAEQHCQEPKPRKKS